MKEQRLGATQPADVHSEVLRPQARNLQHLKQALIPSVSTKRIRSKPATTRRFPWHSTVVLIAGILLGKFHVQIAYEIKRIVYEILPQCSLGEICAWYEKRPYLEDGRLSSSVWDVPRKHLTSNYSALHRFRKGATVKMQTQNPRVVWLSGVVDENELQLLTDAAKHALSKELHDVNSVQETFVHMGEMHIDIAQLLETIVRLIGLPSKRCVEELVFRRYHKDTRIKLNAPWCRSGRMKSSTTPFEECGCAAVALLTLESPEHGGTDIVSERAADNASDEMRVTTDVGDLLAWFIIHPMTEKVQHIRHEIHPVLQGTKLVAELHISDCSCLKNKSHVDNERKERAKSRKNTQSTESTETTESTDIIESVSLSRDNPGEVDMDKLASCNVRNNAECLKDGIGRIELVTWESVDKSEQRSTDLKGER